MQAHARVLGLCALFMTSALQAQDAVPPCGHPVVVPDKPELASYPEYSDFLVDIMKYKQTVKLQQAHRQACPRDYQPKPHHSNDPTVVEGPETLDSAVERAHQIAQMDYSKHDTWYNRTTSRSFALPPMQQQGLADERIRTLLGNAGSDTPMVLPLTRLSLQDDKTRDGSDAQQQDQLYPYQLLPVKERQAEIAAFKANNADEAIRVERSGNLYFYIDLDDDVVATKGRVETEACTGNGCSPAHY
ncbi:hypothetical protein A11A3_00480 [Alcanivorax hongdengensis A-11-3]|uniref:Lipoprotein n=1 Tax=Alcanivorax hongdengensis A-11-3 TaxID=1177179 RepID=L0WGV4_9GAMM|nr:hypothetical protein [Alcanivorax hongdengensis]EKF75924.1 hypothetical protein A11A3_00480 [Alcanivorax hongdengensis A-11-3]